MAKIAVASLALKEVTQCDKIKVAALGNVVPQLHIHIVARCKTDPLWPKPVWGRNRRARAKRRSLRDLSGRFGRSSALWKRVECRAGSLLR
jgi:diadenosine tetraphosphate (Ap4A) HIT family hydrolase